MKSTLAETARADALAHVRRMTPEQRLNAFLQVSQMAVALA